MPYLVLGLFLLVALLLGARAFLSADPKALAKLVRYGGAGLLGVIAFLLVVTGRFGMALPLGVLILMLLGRWPLRMPGSAGFGGLGGLGGLGGMGGPSAGQTSEVETAWLRMVLDHDSGDMHGEVLKGSFAGRSLESLDREHLMVLLSDLSAVDPQSATLLETWLDRHLGPDWREADAGSSGGAYEGRKGGAGAGANGGGSATGRAKMSRAEALEVLGLREGASPEQIRDAHRRLMKKLHPDQGGSNYLASKINAAKDMLLGI